jgi:hypothetical protein
MTYFKVLSYNLPGGTEENHEKPQSGQLVSWWRFGHHLNESQKQYILSQLAWLDSTGSGLCEHCDEA